MNTVVGDDSAFGVRRSARSSYGSNYRRTRRFFRRVAWLAAVSSAMAGGIKFWPLADDLARMSDAALESASRTHGWSGVAIFVFLLVCTMSGFIGYVVIRTLGWWVQMRVSQHRRRQREADAVGQRGRFTSREWEFPDDRSAEDAPPVPEEPVYSAPIPETTESDEAGADRAASAPAPRVRRRHAPLDEAPPRRRRGARSGRGPGRPYEPEAPAGPDGDGQTRSLGPSRAGGEGLENRSGRAQSRGKRTGKRRARRGPSGGRRRPASGGGSRP